jgi:hypothetical protein
MFYDDDHFTDFNDEYLNILVNENVDKYSGGYAQLEDDYVVDDTGEWYNIYGSEADG